MRYTGYVLLAIAAILVMFVIGNTLIDVGRIEDQGVQNAAPASRGVYWVALIPAGLSAVIGLRMVMARDKGYKETYDMRQQQT